MEWISINLNRERTPKRPAPLHDKSSGLPFPTAGTGTDAMSPAKSRLGWLSNVRTGPEASGSSGSITWETQSSILTHGRKAGTGSHNSRKSRLVISYNSEPGTGSVKGRGHGERRGGPLDECLTKSFSGLVFHVSTSSAGWAS